jgi:hypothetical protein
VAAAMLGFVGAAPAEAQAPMPVGPQFQINTYTSNRQYGASAAMDANGSFIVVWKSDGSAGTDTSSYSIQGQRFFPDGSKRGTEFQVNTDTTGNQFLPFVAADADGDFIVVWSTNIIDTADVRGRRYASNGTAQGAEFQVNTTMGLQNGPLVAAAADGAFVVVWTGSYGSPGPDTSEFSIQGRRFASNGSPQGGDFQVNTYTTGSQSQPFVAMDADGNFVVVWQSDVSYGTDTDGDSIQGQRYASNGSPRGGEFQVNTYTTNAQSYPSVSRSADGDFVVVWQSTGSSGTDTSLSSVQGQRYASNGTAEGAQFQVNTYTTSKQGYPSVSMDGTGDFVVVWQSSSGRIQGQRFASDGSVQGAEFQVNTYTGLQRFPAVAADDETFAVAWAGFPSPETDTSSDSIQGRVYALPSVVPSMSGASKLALGMGLLLLGISAIRRHATRMLR